VQVISSGYVIGFGMFLFLDKDCGGGMFLFYTSTNNTDRNNIFQEKNAEG
jgi:hypothetical protein